MSITLKKLIEILKTHEAEMGDVEVNAITVEGDEVLNITDVDFGYDYLGVPYVQIVANH